LSLNLAAISPFRILEGNWTVKYSNGATRTYSFRSNGSAYFHEERKVGRLVRARNGEIIVDFNDNTAERVTLKAELQVDHFNPTNTWRGGGKPTFTGTGERGK
jgi:hypothetical protein